MAITDPTLDPVTGIPLDASYATQYQVPLGSQPINLDELNAQGKQGNWLYPDNLPPVVARLQARDLTNPGNAQDLSTDGKRNLNVNINALNPAVNLGGGGGPISPNWFSNVTNQVEFSTNAQDEMLDGPPNGGGSLFSVNVAAILNPTRSGSPPDIGFGFLWISVRPANGGFPIINLGTMSFLWNGTSGGSECCQTFHRVFSAGLKATDMGFASNELLGLWYQTWNAPYDISGEWCWRI